MILVEEFFTHWCDAIDARREEVNNSWCDNKAYTNLIIHSPNSIVMDVSKKLGLHCYNGDYYYLDSVFYGDYDYIKDFPEQCFLTDIRIAFEHENNFKSGLFQEVAHLLLINCDLKVLVAYPPSESDEIKQLEYLHGIIYSSRISEELSNHRGFLIIMGHEEPYKWVAWLYHQDKWIELANKSM